MPSHISGQNHPDDALAESLKFVWRVLTHKVKLFLFKDKERLSHVEVLLNGLVVVAGRPL